MIFKMNDDEDKTIIITIITTRWDYFSHFNKSTPIFLTKLNQFNLHDINGLLDKSINYDIFKKNIMATFYYIG